MVTQKKKKKKKSRCCSPGCSFISSRNAILGLVDASRRGKKELKKSSRDKNARHETVVGGEGGKKPAIYVTPDLSYDQEGERTEGRR